MAFLFLLCEKMRMQRKINKLTLEDAHFGNIAERMEKKTKNREKFYAKLEKQIERQAQAYKTYADANMNSIFTAGCDPSAIYGGQMNMGTSALQQQAILAACSSLGCDQDDLINWIQNGGSVAYTQDSANKDKKDAKDKWFEDATGNRINGEQYALLQKAAAYVQQYQSNMTQQINAWKTAYSQQVDQWAEIQKEQLDNQRELEMDLLAEEQADIEADKASVEAQLQMAKDRKEAIEQHLGEAIKDAAPKFGLG